jgi:hypothetical protein
LLFLLFLDFLTVYLDVGICHSVLLLRKKIINLRSSGHSSPTNSYSCSTDSIASSSRYHLALRVFKLRNIHGIFFSSKLLKDRYRKWPGKRLICFAGDGELDIIDIDILFFVVRNIIRQPSILPEYLGLLENLSGIVVHELNELVDYVFLIVFDT